MAFHELQAKVFQAFGEGLVDEALALTMAAMEHYPEELHTLYYWRISLHSALGEETKALALCEEVINRGLWLAVDYFEGDPDMQRLKGKPAFERLVRWSQERLAEAQAAASPACLTVLPLLSDLPMPLVMALHGNGENPHVEAHHWTPLTDQGWLVALPQSTQVTGPRNFVWTDHSRGIADAQRYFKEVLSSRSVDVQRVILGGFSMGGGLAVRLALSGAISARGYIGVAPYLPEGVRLQDELTNLEGKSVRGYLLVGDQDKPAMALAEQLNRLMAERGQDCHVEVCPGLGHAYPEQFAESLNRAVAFILGE